MSLEIHVTSQAIDKIQDHMKSAIEEEIYGELKKQVGSVNVSHGFLGFPPFSLLGKVTIEPEFHRQVGNVHDCLVRARQVVQDCRTNSLETIKANWIDAEDKSKDGIPGNEVVVYQ